MIAGDRFGRMPHLRFACKATTWSPPRGLGAKDVRGARLAPVLPSGGEPCC